MRLQLIKIRTLALKYWTSALVVVVVLVLAAFGLRDYLSFKGVLKSTDTTSENKLSTAGTVTSESSPATTIDSDNKFTSYVDGFSANFNGKPEQQRITSPDTSVLRNDYSFGTLKESYVVTTFGYPMPFKKEINQALLETILKNTLGNQDYNSTEPPTYDANKYNGQLNFMLYNYPNNVYAKGMLIAKKRDTMFYIYMVSVMSKEKELKGADTFLNSFVVLK